MRAVPLPDARLDRIAAAYPEKSQDRRLARSDRPRRDLLRRGQDESSPRPPPQGRRPRPRRARLRRRGRPARPRAGGPGRRHPEHGGRAPPGRPRPGRRAAGEAREGPEKDKGSGERKGAGPPPEASPGARIGSGPARGPDDGGRGEARPQPRLPHPQAPAPLHQPRRKGPGAYPEARRLFPALSARTGDTYPGYMSPPGAGRRVLAFLRPHRSRPGRARRLASAGPSWPNTGSPR